jgi:anaerobic ribonucleoside-triphosphate reductase activating protein
VWFQGCTIGCPGCFNPETHDASGGSARDSGTLAAELLALPGVDGVSFSGGEPFQQPDALADLAGRLRPAGLSLLVFSGYTRAAIERMARGPEILGLVDVLIAGPYQAEQHSGRGLLGSANQRIHLLSGRHRLEEFAGVPQGEVILHRDGSITITGIVPLAIQGGGIRSGKTPKKGL